jgi:hypothetical protein
MRSTTLALVLGFACLAQPGIAKDRPVTDEEKTKLTAAVTAEGCTAAKMEFDDDGHYEVDDARCGDGRKYDLKFDKNFKLIKKDPD